MSSVAHELLEKVDEIKEKLTSEEYKSLCDTFQKLNKSQTEDEYTKEKYTVDVFYTKVTSMCVRINEEGLEFEHDEELGDESIALKQKLHTEMVHREFVARFRKNFIQGQSRNIRYNVAQAMDWYGLRWVFEQSTLRDTPFHYLVRPITEQVSYVTSDKGQLDIDIENTGFVVQIRQQ